MKGLALILALVIFSTSLKASAFISGVTGAVEGVSSSYSCCKKTDDSSVKNCEESEEDQEESGCCDADSCNCTCCVHIVYLQHLSSHSISSNEFSEVRFGYSFLYKDDYLSSIFHPPSFL